MKKIIQALLLTSLWLIAGSGNAFDMGKLKDKLKTELPPVNPKLAEAVK